MKQCPILDIIRQRDTPGSFQKKRNQRKKNLLTRKRKRSQVLSFRDREWIICWENLLKKFPPKVVQPIHTEVKEEPVKQEAVVKQEIKQEKPDDKANSIKPPPEKRAKLTR